MNRSFRDSEARKELRALYEEVDALTQRFTCDRSTDCCHFGRTGRQPYPTAIELAEVRLALGGRAPTIPPKRARDRSRALPLANADRPCPLLDASGRCRVYAARPFGCRTFFCERAVGPAGERAAVDKGELRRIAHAIADLSARFDPKDPHPRRAR
jgi:hypothetical protein